MEMKMLNLLLLFFFFSVPVFTIIYTICAEIYYHFKFKEKENKILELKGENNDCNKY